MAFSKLSSLAERDWSHVHPTARDHPRVGHHYDPNQPRMPAGHSNGGQWTSDGGSDFDATRRWLEIFQFAVAADSWRGAVAVPNIPRPGYTPLASAFAPSGSFQIASQFKRPGQLIPGVTDPLEGGRAGGRNTGGAGTSGRPSLSARRAEQLKINKAAGAEFENKTGAELQQQRRTVEGQITIETPSGARTRMDFVTRAKRSGLIECVECKASQKARVTPKQAEAHRQIENSGGTVVGAGKPGFPGGTKIPSHRVKIIRGP